MLKAGKPGGFPGPKQFFKMWNALPLLLEALRDIIKRANTELDCYCHEIDGAEREECPEAMCVKCYILYPGGITVREKQGLTDSEGNNARM